MDSDAPAQRSTQLRTEYEFQCTQAECTAALKFNQSRLLRRLQRTPIAAALRVLAFSASFLFVLLTVLLVYSGSRQRLAFFVFALLVVSLWSRIAWQHRLFRSIAIADTSLSGSHLMTIEEGGLRARNSNKESFVGWSGIRSIEEVGGLILLYLDDVSFTPIPASAFSDSTERAEFLAELRRRTAAEEKTEPVAIVQTTSSQSTEQTLHEPPSAPNRRASILRGLASESTAQTLHRWPTLANLRANIIQGFRLAFFLRPKMDGAYATEASWSTLVALLLFSVAISFLAERVPFRPYGLFVAYVLPGAAFSLPVMMVGAWALALLAGRTERTLALLVAMASLAIPIALIEFFLRLKLDKALSAQALLLIRLSGSVWLALASSVAAIRLLGARKRKWPAAALLSFVLVTLPLAVSDRTLWWAFHNAEADNDEDRPRVSVASEEVFYLQPKLLERQLAGLKVGRKGVIDLYFVGVAAYAEQDVFMKEVQSVAKLFEERFDTAGRSVMLINNPSTLREWPIASATSVGIALKRVAEVMDRDEDILFLFITSHGSKEQGTTFQFSPMSFDPLDPKRLKRLLDQFGFKRRVVVVSSCYSGSFVDALMDDGTLVISASAPDKNSFGCSNDADFTYFGKAYFDEALRRTYSFSEAFDMARPVIAERERKENYVPSDPRMFVGEGIKGALEEFVSLRRSGGPRPSRDADE